MRAFAILGLLAASALAMPAAVVFHEGFNDYAQGTYTASSGLGSIWSVNGTVDVVHGSWDGPLCRDGNNVCVDLDGTGALGTITHTMILDPGYYTVSFRLAGSLRGNGNNSAAVSFGGWSGTYTLPADTPFQQFASGRIYSNGTPMRLSFSGVPPADNRGLILDDIAVASSVPEPGTVALFLSGLGVFAGVLARRKK